MIIRSWHPHKVSEWLGYDDVTRKKLGPGHDLGQNALMQPRTYFAYCADGLQSVGEHHTRPVYAPWEWDIYAPRVHPQAVQSHACSASAVDLKLASLYIGYDGLCRQKSEAPSRCGT